MHVEDTAEAVIENRRRLRALLDLPTEPAWLEQVHGADVADLDRQDMRVDMRVRADAAVTRQPGRVCAILVADCMPVLFATRDGSAVGAAHAGWRGLASGVLEATAAALAADPAELVAWLGPAIGSAHFEVGEDVRSAFVGRDPGAASAFVANSRGRWQCNLEALVRRRLASLGIRSVSGGGWCTYADAARFFSYRRDRRCGRMAALIWLRPDGA
jgi:YfiH family protein